MVVTDLSQESYKSVFVYLFIYYFSSYLLGTRS